MSFFRKFIEFFSTLGSRLMKLFDKINFNSIRIKLILAFLSLIIPILVLGLVSYTMARNAMRSHSVTTAESITNSNAQYIKLLTDNIEEVSIKFLADEDIRDYLYNDTSDDAYTNLTRRRKIDSELQSYTISGKTIADIVLLSSDDLTVSTSGYQAFSLNLDAISDTEFIEKAKKGDGKIVWAGFHKELDEYSSVSGKTNYSLTAFRLLKNQVASDTLGILIIDIKDDIVNSMLKQTRITENSEVHILTPDGRDISSKGGTLEKSFIFDSEFYKEHITKYIEENEPDEIVTQNFQESFNGEKYQVIYSILPNSNFSIVSLIPLADINRTSNAILGVTIALILFSFAFAVLVALAMSTSMGRTINRIRDVAEMAATGDLTVLPISKRKDELGLLTHSIASMISSMRNLITEATTITLTVANSANTVSSTSQQVSAVSQEISRAIQEISEGASAQASDAEQSALKMRQLSIKINTVTVNTKSIEKITHDTLDLTQNGLESIEAMGEKSKETTEITRAILTDIKKLDEHSKSIGKIIKVIRGIADQTNLLALNAAIEAARAGEMGKGFAVVADEVKKLAEKSMSSTREIGSIIKSTQTQTRQAVERAEKTEAIIVSQNEAVETAIGSFKNISNSMTILVSSVNAILRDVIEMDADKEHTNLAIQNISAVSEETAASSEEVTASTQEQLSSIEELSYFAAELGDSAEKLKQAISMFKVSNDD